MQGLINELHVDTKRSRMQWQTCPKACKLSYIMRNTIADSTNQPDSPVKSHCLASLCYLFLFLVYWIESDHSACSTSSAVHVRSAAAGISHYRLLSLPSPLSSLPPSADITALSLSTRLLYDKERHRLLLTLWLPSIFILSCKFGLLGGSEQSGYALVQESCSSVD